MARARHQGYQLRTLIEHLNARLKDESGGQHIRVRGHRKMLVHLLLDVLMLAVDQVPRLAT